MLKDDVIGLLGRILDSEEFDPRFKKPNRASDAPLSTPVVQARETIPMKPLSLSELEGYPYLTTMSDRTAAGGQLVGVGDKSLAYPVNLTGGQDFMRDFTQNPNLWASAEGVVPKMVTAARELEGEYGRQPVFMPWSMTPTGSDFSGMTGKTMFSYASENMPQTFKKEVDAHMKLYVPDWKGIDNPESGAQFDALPDKARKKAQGYMDTKFRNVGGITLPQTRIAIADQSQLNQPVMGFKNVGLIDTSVDALAGAGNPTYPSALAGKYMGTLDTDVTAIDLNPNRYARKRKADGSFFEDPQGKDFLSTKTAPRRSMEVNYYGGLIDEPLLRSLDDRGFKVKSGLLPTAATLGTAAMSLLGSEEADAAIIPKLSQAARSVSKQEIERIKRGEALGYNMSPEAKLYHASKQDINQFEAGYDDGLIFTTPDPEFANKWLGKGKFQQRQGEQAQADVKNLKKSQRDLRDDIFFGKNNTDNAWLELEGEEYNAEYDRRQKIYRDDISKDIYASDMHSTIYPLVTKTKKPFIPDQDVDVLEELYGKEYMAAPFGSGFPTYKDALKDGNYLLYENKQVVDFLKGKGYDSIFIKESAGAENPYTTLALFDAKDLKSPHAQFKDPNNPNILAGAGALGLMSLFMPEEAEAAGLVAAVPSIARKLLDDPNAPKKNTPQGWANYLKNNGAKPNEIEKYNLDLIDSKRPLDKEEVSQYLLDNEYQFGRSLYTEQPDQLDVDVMREQYKDYFDEKAEKYGATTADINYEIGGLLDEKRPKFRTDRSDGDITNYRNQVLTDPSGEQIDKYIGMNTQSVSLINGQLHELDHFIDIGKPILDNVDGKLVELPMEKMIARRTKLQTDKARLEKLRNQSENRLFVESSHFTEPNAIGHVRTTDRVNTFDPRTGKKTEYRLMEEVQSDWVQRAENPDYGIKDVEAMDNLYDAMYESKVNQYKAMANASPDEKEGIFNEYLAEQADISRRLDSMNRSKEGLALVPQPPVAKPHIPLVNQTIIDAVDDNMDGVGIVTGDTQLAAKDQFQFINDISWKSVKSEGGAAEILFDFSGITNRQGDVGTVHQQLSMDIEKDLKAFRTMMPKGAADQIIDDVKAAVARGDDSGVMSNFNTQVEGKKLRPYYNKTLRKHLEQIGKQYGVKVEKRINTEMYSIDDLDDGYYAVVRDGDVLEEFDDIDEAKQYLSKQQMGADDHFYLPFTDKMKADVKKNGLKMFSTIGLTPVAIDAMRSNVTAEDERMRVVYDDTDTQREENRAAIEDMLARDSKTRRREELGDTLTGLLDAPRTALNLAGDAVTNTLGGLIQFPLEMGVRAFEKAVPALNDSGIGDEFAEGFSGLYKQEPRNRKEELIKGQIGENVTSALQASAPYLRDAYTHEGLLGAPSIQDMVQATKQGYQSLPEGYLKDNALPAAGLSALGVLGMYDVLGLRRKAAQAAQQNMMPQGLLN